MKVFSFLSAFTLLGAASASCANKNSLAARQIPQLYSITIKSGFKELNNQHLSIDSGTLGVYQSNSGVQKLRITTTAVGKKSALKFSLKPYPASTEEHALGLVGINGYLELKDMKKPSNHKISLKETYSWKEFTLGKPDKKCVQEIIYKDVKPGWIASPAGNNTWRIKNYNGDMVVVQNYIPVKLYLEPVALKIE